MKNTTFAALYGTGSPLTIPARRRPVDYAARLTRAAALAAAALGFAVLLAGPGKAADDSLTHIKAAAWGSVAPALCGIALTPTGMAGQAENNASYWNNPAFQDAQAAILRAWPMLRADLQAADCADLRARLVAGGFAY